MKTERGERIRKWLRRRFDNNVSLGIKLMAVTYADSRSGWSAVQVQVFLVFWTITFVPIKWRNGPPDNYRFVTMAEQIRQTHSQGPSLEEQEAKEAAEKADEKARLALFQKQLDEWDAKHKESE